MKFSEMKYKRPDVEEAKKQAEEIKKNFISAESFEDAEKAFLDWDRFSSHIDTMMSLAYTRNTINT
ncbi:MAG: M3 family oligoendopeptidase, partial [Clostridia bacterium]|nr:M3 family oligoendopeptidase [Clostridia bacterium]